MDQEDWFTELDAQTEQHGYKAVRIYIDDESKEQPWPAVITDVKFDGVFVVVTVEPTGSLNF